MKKFLLLVIVLGLGLFAFSQTQKVVNEPLPEELANETSMPAPGAEDSIEMKLQDPEMVEQLFPEDLSASEEPSTPQLQEIAPLIEKAEDPNMTEEELQEMDQEAVAIMNPEPKAMTPVEAIPAEEMEAKGIRRQGSFVGADSFHQGSGLALLVPSASLLRLENFEVTRGPDLRVSAITTAEERIDLGALKGNAGNQNYNIPSSTDPDDIASIQIWCRAFNVTFATAVLQ